MMDFEDKLAGLYGAVEDQQKAAKKVLDDLVQERVKLAVAIDSIKNASSSLQTATETAASKAVTETLGKAPNTAVEALGVATEALDNAADKVRDAGAWISWKFALVFALAGAAAVATNYTIGRFTLPDRAEVEAHRAELAQLRLEKAELEANITTLAKRGGRIKLSTCGTENRLCVQITTKQGSAPGQTAYQGAWLSDSKKHFAIPHGY
jgi:cell division protein FtsB